MTVSTTTDPLLDLVDLTVNLLPLPFAKAPPDPFVQSPSETLRTAAAVGDDVAPDPVAPDHEAETAACPLPVEESLSDARRATGGVEGGGSGGLIGIVATRPPTALRGRRLFSCTPVASARPPTSGRRRHDWQIPGVPCRGCPVAVPRHCRPGPPEDGGRASIRGRHEIWCPTFGGAPGQRCSDA